VTLPPRSQNRSRRPRGGVLRSGLILIFIATLHAESVLLPGLLQPVDILRDRWGVPHIYAANSHDLFFAQGYIAARDRLFQIDVWRRAGTGQLAEALGPSAIERDRFARSVRYRGDMNAEWKAYGPDTRAIATAFTDGINAYIRQLNGRRPEEFTAAGFDPGLWKPEDCLARVAGMPVSRNVVREVRRAADIRLLGLQTVQQNLPPDPAIPIEVPRGLDLADVVPDVLRAYQDGVGPARFGEPGSNNWVVDGTMTASGKPLLANDPHRPIQIPSLRKTVHLVAPGWNAIGAGEPALPGIALGHNDRIAFGFTIVGIDQQDLYVETLHPDDPERYRYRGEWKRMQVERQQIRVRGRQAPETVELRYTVHGPVLHVDRARKRAYAMRWVGTEPGTAGYLAGLAVARARNWKEFLGALERYRLPSENLVYADVDGNIGWQAAGLSPIRPNWSGLLPVPGDGDYEWSGFRKLADLPRLFNPPSHWIATANHNILPPGYKLPLGYEWAQPFRYDRIREVLQGARKLTVADCERLQQDVVSMPARRFQAVLKRWNTREPLVREMLAWDARLSADSRPALVYQYWLPHLASHLFPEKLASRVLLTTFLAKLESAADARLLETTFKATLVQLEKSLGGDRNTWRWGRVHQAVFRHPLNRPAWNRGPVERPGDAHTVNSTGGPAGSQSTRQTDGASYRQVIDLADWDRSTMTNVPGESGNPSSPHYADLIQEWAAGRYHPMLYSRKAIEAATVERIRLTPAGRTGVR
jgi:penicillin amidase